MGLPPKNVFFKHKFRNKLEIMFKRFLLFMIMNTTSSYTIFDGVASHPFCFCMRMTLLEGSHAQGSL